MAKKRPARTKTKTPSARTVPPADHRTLSPLPKLSATLLEFAAPLLDTAPDASTLEHVTNVMKLVSIAWNLPILERAGQGAEIRAGYAWREALIPPELRAVLRKMMRERLDRWGHDPRLAGVIEVVVQDGKHHLLVSSHLPDADKGRGPAGTS